MIINSIKDVSMGYQLKLVRNSARVSQSAAAKKVYGIPQGNLSSMENGRIFPSIEHVSAAYYSMGYFIEISDFLLDSWLKKLLNKIPYNKVFESTEDLKSTIISYVNRFPNYRIEKMELLKFKKEPSEYQLPSDALHISPLVFDKEDFIIASIDSYNKLLDTQNIPKENSTIISYLEETIYNLNALLTLHQELNEREDDKNELTPSNSLNDWIENELKHADMNKLEQLKRFWDNIK